MCGLVICKIIGKKLLLGGCHGVLGGCYHGLLCSHVFWVVAVMFYPVTKAVAVVLWVVVSMTLDGCCGVQDGCQGGCYIYCVVALVFWVVYRMVALVFWVVSVVF